jgi:tetratricopeptide (TPR) repeat protein
LSATAFLGTYERDADGSRLYHEALSLFKAVGDQWRQAEMLGGWWSVGRGAIGDYIERVSIEQMFLADQLGDPWLRADSRIARGAALTAAGRFDEARPALDRGLELARTVGNPSQIAWVLLECGRHALTTANLPQARVLFSERLAITRRLRDTLGNAISLWALGTVASYTGDIEAGRRIHLERLQYELHLGHAPGIADSYNSLAEIELSAGDLTQAETYAAQGHEIAHVVEDVALLKSLIMRADIMLYQGKLDRAEQLAREAEAQARRLNDTDRQIFALVCLSQIALQRAAPEWARACFLEASAYDDFYVYQLESPTFCEVAGACLAANVRPREAASLWGAAEAIRERHGTPLLPVHRPLYEQRLTTARQLLPPEEWDAVWEAGRALTWHAALRQAVAYLQDATGAADG